jgi:sugar phosphate isomerase/epimerase
MPFAVRREVTLEDHEQDLKGLQGIPIELALPYQLKYYLQNRDKLGALATYVKDQAVICASVHATQGRLTDDGCMSWAGETVRFAEAVGAEVVVFHPEATRKDERANLQIIALRNIRDLQRGTAVRICVETFGSAKRVLLPEEVGEKGLWMVLDTSHVFQDRALDLIERYHGTIAAVHLSEMRLDEKTGEKRPHMPVTGFGLEVLRLLQEKGWHGVVTLEYLPDHHDQLLPDRQALADLFPGI